MKEKDLEWKIRPVSSISEISESVWKGFESADFPFNDFEFFLALEETGCVGKGTGWQTLYLLCEDEAGEVLGILYAFVKQHSYGEYIFDWQWANFYQANGADYYPKLLTAVPFTPATGPRILLKADSSQPEAVRSALIRSALEIARRSSLSSYHALFIEENEQDAFQKQGMMIRYSLQYHWRNQDYKTFQDFLDQLIGKRRRDIVRERTRAASHGLSIECLTGADLKPHHAAIMNALYQTTTDKKNAIAYLTPEFFTRIFASMNDRILFVLASKDGEPVAGALNFYKGGKLFGRYWGALASYADLHFELCYYQTIDFAIRNHIQVFEAGAQGEHKVQRGFSPSLTYSAHAIFDPRFAGPIKHFVHEERVAILEHMKDFSTPFRT